MQKAADQLDADPAAGDYFILFAPLSPENTRPHFSFYKHRAATAFGFIQPRL
jgi:hypothetical protein